MSSYFGNLAKVLALRLWHTAQENVPTLVEEASLTAERVNTD